MKIDFDMADIKDIDSLIDLRVAYMLEDYGIVTKDQEKKMRAQIRDYMQKALGKDIFGYVARVDGKVVSIAYLHVIDMPATPVLTTGRYGEVLNVYTLPEYRGKGLCTKIIQGLLNGGKELNLEKIVLSATKDGYPIYKKLGFDDKKIRYTDMQYVL